MKYSIIIPTYNHCDDLLKPCIDSILRTTDLDQIELIVSANGCKDNSRWYLDRLNYQFSSMGFGNHFKLVWNDSPLGFAKACNEGIKASTGQRIVLLNNDVVLLDQPKNNWLDRLNQPFDGDPAMGITGSLKLYSDQTKRDFILFFCAMIDRKVIDRIGLLNEEYGVGSAEDIEYCWQAQSAGFKIKCVTETVFSPEMGTNVSDFPLWHKAEGTMHDAELVPNWDSIFQGNMEKLAQKYAATTLLHTDVAAKYQWLKEGAPDAWSLFDEVIAKNTYKLTQEQVHNTAVIDIGANQGMFSILAASLGAPEVLACEPVSAICELLRHNVNKTGLDKVVQVVQAAVGGKPSGPMTIGVHDDSGYNSLYKPGNFGEMVNTTTLAELISKVSHKHVYLKMDCEGAEYDILFDSEPGVFDRVSRIAVEIHGDIHPKYQGVELAQNRLAELGFVLDDRQAVGFIWLDQQGNQVGFDPYPMTIELWRRP